MKDKPKLAPVKISTISDNQNQGCMKREFQIGAQLKFINYMQIRDQRDFPEPQHPFYLAPVTNNDQPNQFQRWLICQLIGRNKINNLMKTMSQKANLPDTEFKRFTNTSARKHLCQKLLNNNVPESPSGSYYRT